MNKLFALLSVFSLLLNGVGVGLVPVAAAPPPEYEPVPVGLEAPESMNAIDEASSPASRADATLTSGPLASVPDHFRRSVEPIPAPDALPAWYTADDVSSVPDARSPAAPRAPLNDGPVLSVGKSVSDEPLVGGQISYGINIKNTATDYDTDRGFNLTVTDTLPDGLKFASASPYPNDIIENNDDTTTLRWIDIKNLEAQEGYQLTISADILSDVKVDDSITNFVTATVNTAPDFSGDVVSATGSVSATVQAIDIEKAALQSTGVSQATGAGGYLTATGRIAGPDWPYVYKLTVKNNNITGTTNVVVTDTLPPGAAFLGGTWYVQTDTLVTPVSPTTRLNSDGSLDLWYDVGTLSTTHYATPVVITFPVAIPYSFRTASGPISGTGPYDGDVIPDDHPITNTYEATGLYDGTDPTADGTESTPQDDSPNKVNAAYLTVEKGVTPGSVRHGTEVTYTINYYVSEYYTFTQVKLVDVLTDGLTYGGKVSGPGSDPVVSTDTPITGATTLTFYIPAANTEPGAWDTVKFTATVDGEYEHFDLDPHPPIVAGDSLGNRVTVSGHYTDAIATTVRTGTSEDADGASVGLIFPEMEKLVRDPETGDFINGPVTVTVGDQLAFSLTFTVPHHIAVRNIIVDDFLPRGMSYVSGTASYSIYPDFTPSTSRNLASHSDVSWKASYSSIDVFTDSPYITTTVQLTDCIADPEPTNPSTKTLSGLEDLEWDLCSISHTKDVVWQALVTATVEDVPQVANGKIVANFGNASGLSTYGQSYSLRDRNKVKYVEPILVLEKTVKTWNNREPGDTVTYTIEVENQGDSPAFNVVLTDTIPKYVMVVDGASSSGGSPYSATYTDLSGDPGGGNGGVISWTNVHIPAGRTQTYTYTAVISEGVGARRDLVNIASVEYNSLPDDSGRQTEWTSDTAAKNTDDATVRIINLKVEKSAAPSRVTIGDIYTQFVTITVPAGTRVYTRSSGYVTVKDEQNTDGIEFITSTAKISDVADSPVNGASFATPSTTVDYSGSGATIDFNLEEIDNSDNSSDYVFQITIQVLVTGLDDDGTSWEWFKPQTGDQTSDRFQVLFNDGDENQNSPWSSRVEIDVDQPLLELEKTVTPETGDGGDAVTYTLDVKNTGYNIAYDVVLTDAIPVNVIVSDTGGSGSPYPVTYTVLSASPQTGAGGVITWTVVPSIAVGATQRYTYTATVSGTVPAGSDWTNTADVDWSTQEGDTDDERVFDDSSQETYTKDTDSAALNIDTPLLDKTIFDTSLDATGKGRHETGVEDLAIGEIVTFHIVITLPEGTTPSVLTDTMPYTSTYEGVLGVLSSKVLAFGSNITATGDQPGDPGTHTDLYSSYDISDTVEFDFGIVTNTPDGVVDGNDCITVEVVARAEDVSENEDGDYLTSTATLDYNTGTLSDAVNVEIVEPDLTIGMTSNPGDTEYIDEGDRITYFLHITNSGTMPAYDIVISDTLPFSDLTTYITSTISSNTPSTIAFDYEPPVGATDFITWQVNELWVGSAVITVVVQVTDTVLAETYLTNTATITYYDSLPDDDSPDEREYSDGSADVYHWTGPNALDLNKEAEPSPVIAGTPLTYTITLTNVGGGSLTGVFITDTIPLSTTFITATLPHTGPVPSVDAGRVITWPLGPMSKNEKQVVTMVVLVDSSVISGSVITNTAWAACDQPFTGTATVTTPVNTRADLTVVKSDDPDPVASGRTLAYTLNYVNNGPSYARNVYITDTLPFSVTYGGVVSVTPPLFGPTETVGPPFQLTWYTPTLPDGTSGTIQFTITVLLTTTDPFSNSVVITSTTPDPITDNNFDIEWTAKPPPVGGVTLPNPLRALFRLLKLLVLLGLLLAGGAVVARRKRAR